MDVVGNAPVDAPTLADVAHSPASVDRFSLEHDPLTDPSPASTAPSSAMHHDVPELHDKRARSPAPEGFPDPVPAASHTPLKSRTFGSSMRRHHLGDSAGRSLRSAASGPSSRSGSPASAPFAARRHAPGRDDRGHISPFAHSPGVNSFQDESFERSQYTASGGSSRYLITVVPPAQLPADPPRVSPACSGYGPPAAFRYAPAFALLLGIWLIASVPMQTRLLGASLSQPLLADRGYRPRIRTAVVGRHCPLSSGKLGCHGHAWSTDGQFSSGLCASITQPAKTQANGPRVGEEAWRMLWAGIFEEEAAFLDLEQEGESIHLGRSSDAGLHDESSASDYDEPPPVPPIPFPHRGPSSGENVPAFAAEASSLSGRSSASGLALAEQAVAPATLDAGETSRASLGSRSGKGSPALRSGHPKSDQEMASYRGVLGPRRGSTPAGSYFGTQTTGASLMRSSSSASRRSRRPRGITAAPANAPHFSTGPPSAGPSRRPDHEEEVSKRSLAGGSPSPSASFTDGLPPRPVGAGVIVGKIEFDIDTRRGAGRWFESWLSAVSQPKSTHLEAPSTLPVLVNTVGVEDDVDANAQLRPLRLVGSQHSLGADSDQRKRTATELSENATVRVEDDGIASPKPAMEEVRRLVDGVGDGADPSTAALDLERPASLAESHYDDSSAASEAAPSEAGYQPLVDDDDGAQAETGSASPIDREATADESGPAIVPAGTSSDPLADVFGDDAATWASVRDGDGYSDVPEQAPRGLGLVDDGSPIAPPIMDDLAAPGAQTTEDVDASQPPPPTDVEEVAQLLSEQRKGLDPLSSPIHLDTATMEGPPALESTPPTRSAEVFIPPSRKSSRRSPLRDVGNSTPPPLPPTTPTRLAGEAAEGLKPLHDVSGQRRSQIEMTANLDSLERALAELSPRALRESPRQRPFAAIGAAYQALPPITMTEPSPHQRSPLASVRKVSVGETEGYGRTTAQEMDAPITPGVRINVADPASPPGHALGLSSMSPPPQRSDAHSSTPPAQTVTVAPSSASSAGSGSPKPGSPTSLLSTSRSAPFAALREKAAKSFSRSGSSDASRPKSPTSSFRSVKTGAKAAFNFWQTKHQDPQDAGAHYRTLSLRLFAD